MQKSLPVRWTGIATSEHQLTRQNQISPRNLRVPLSDMFKVKRLKSAHLEQFVESIFVAKAHDFLIFAAQPHSD